MLFEYIVINNIQGVGVGKVFMFWDIAPKEIICFADFIMRMCAAWWRGQWSADRVLGMCLLWRKTAALIWDSQMEAALWQPWQFCSELHPAGVFPDSFPRPLGSCPVVFLSIWDTLLSSPPGLTASCLFTSYLKYQLFGKVLTDSPICFVKLKFIFLSRRFHEFLQMHSVSWASLSPTQTSLGALGSQPCPSHFNPGYREPKHVPLVLCFPECSRDRIIQGPAFWFWLHMCN